MTTPTVDTQAAQAAGVQLEEKVIADYWGFSETENWYFPDGVQYLVLQRMNEGAKAKYQRSIRSDITIARSTGDAKMKADPATERHELLKACIVNWNLYKDGQPAPFNVSGRTPNLEQFLSVADPRIIEDIEKACRKLNPWLTSDVTVEEIDKQIEELQELREEVLQREQGE